MGWEERLAIVYELSEPYLVRKFRQSDLPEDDHDQTGFCLGLCFNWMVQLLDNISRPVPSLAMRKVRFAQALGNLQAWAAKGHIPTGGAMQGLTIPDPESDAFDPRRKPIIPDTRYESDVRRYNSSYHLQTWQDVGRTRTELGKVEDLEAYGEKVFFRALARYKERLKDRSQNFGFLSPMLSNDVVCVGRRESRFGYYQSKVIREKEMREKMNSHIGLVIDGQKPIRGAFMALYKAYLADVHELARALNVDPMGQVVCGINGWLGGVDGAAHAVAISWLAGISSEVRFFDPNVGDFCFSSWSEFRWWHSVFFAGLYNHRAYTRYDLELYARRLV